MKNTFIKLKGGNWKMQEKDIIGNKPDFTGSLDIAV